MRTGWCGYLTTVRDSATTTCAKAFITYNKGWLLMF